VDAIRANS
jgi:hypothetical protein